MGFAPSRSVHSNMALEARKSVALPFLNAPAKLDGTAVGDYGFDPLGFTDTLQDLSYVKQAEIKHGRVAMLATVGYVVQQSFHFASSEANPLKAVQALGFGPNLQVLFAIGCVELATWKATFDGKGVAGTLCHAPFAAATRLSSSVASLYMHSLHHAHTPITRTHSLTHSLTQP